MIAQCWAIGTTLVWSGVISAILYFVIDKVIGFRATPEVEREGLDIIDHGERAYHY
jgi:Amt family ammonium transporter